MLRKWHQKSLEGNATWLEFPHLPKWAHFRVSLCVPASIRSTLKYKARALHKRLSSPDTWTIGDFSGMEFHLGVNTKTRCKQYIHDLQNFAIDKKQTKQIETSKSQVSKSKRQELLEKGAKRNQRTPPSTFNIRNNTIIMSNQQLRNTHSHLSNRQNTDRR